jgi:hypothetical protein
MKPEAPVYDQGGIVGGSNVSGFRKMAAPIMDNGGDVKNINDGQHQVAILQTGERVLDRNEAARYRQMHGSKMPTMHESMDVDTGKPSSSLPELTPETKPTPTAPLYDMGGDVENEDEGTGKKRTEEEQGAPLDFGGRVIPNTKGVKSELDSEHVPTPMTYPGGAKMNIDNAPLDDKESDKTFPTVMPTEASAQTKLKPYSQVLEDKAKENAAAKVNGDRGAQVSGDQQAAQPQAPPEKPEQLPTATHEERIANEVDTQKAMSKGTAGIADLGTAKIHAKMLGIDETPSVEGMTAPKEFARQDATPKLGIPKMGEATPEATPAAPAAGPAAPAAAPTTTSERSPEFKAKLEQLKMDHANALAERTPEGKVKADYIQEQINDLHKNNPWGTAGNHPGAMGKLGHIAGKFGNIAGNLVGAPEMALIPGTDLNNKVQEAGLQKQTQADVQEATAREAEENKTGAAAKDEWKPVAGSVGPNGRIPLLNARTNEVKEAPEGFTPYDKPEHLGDQATYIAQWYKDHKDAPKSTANDDMAIEAYGAAKSAAAEENKAKGKVYYYDTPDGRRGYTYAEAKAAGLKPGEDGYAVSAGQAEKDQKANDTYEGLKTQLATYRDNIVKSAGTLLPSDVENMASMVESAESPDYVSKIVTGALDDFYGKPVTGYNEKVMKGTLTKTAYDNMSPAARQLVADYFTTLLAHFGNVKASLGQVPRNEKLITTEMNMIPKPYLSAKEAEPAFNNYVAQVERNNAHNVKFGPQKTETNAPANAAHQEPKPEDFTRPDGTHPTHVARSADGHIIVFSGKEGDPWIPAEEWVKQAAK